MKSKTGSVAPTEFVGLKPKMYSLNVAQHPAKSQKKVKSVPKHYVKTSSSYKFPTNREQCQNQIHM